MEREILGASDSSRARPDYVGLLGYSVFGYLEGLGVAAGGARGRSARRLADLHDARPAGVSAAREGHGRGRGLLRARRLAGRDGSRARGAAPREPRAALPGRVSRGPRRPGLHREPRRARARRARRLLRKRPVPALHRRARAAEAAVAPALLRLQHGAPREQPLLPGGRLRRHGALAGAAAAPGAVQLRAPHRARLGPQARVRRGLLPLLVGARDR